MLCVRTVTEILNHGLRFEMRIAVVDALPICWFVIEILFAQCALRICKGERAEDKNCSGNHGPSLDGSLLALQPIETVLIAEGNTHLIAAVGL